MSRGLLTSSLTVRLAFRRQRGGDFSFFILPVNRFFLFSSAAHPGQSPAGAGAEPLGHGRSRDGRAASRGIRMIDPEPNRVKLGWSTFCLCLTSPNFLGIFGESRHRQGRWRWPALSGGRTGANRACAEVERTGRRGGRLARRRTQGVVGLVFAAPFAVGEAESTQRPRLIKRKNPRANFFTNCLGMKAIQRARDEGARGVRLRGRSFRARSRPRSGRCRARSRSPRA